MASTAATPTSAVIGLTVGENGLVSEADQQAESVTITGTLSAPPAAGDIVQVQLPNGGVRQATVAQDGIGFSLVLTGTDTIGFSIPGQVTAFIADQAGDQSAAVTQNFVPAAARTILPITSTPADFSASGASALALSGDGATIAFVSNQVVDNAVQFGLYIQQLGTGTLTLVTTDGRNPGLNGDGTLIAYQANQNFTNQVFLENLATGVVTQLSDPDGGGSTSNAVSTRPGIADDGTVVFESTDGTALNGNAYQQVFAARVSGDALARTLISAGADGTPGSGTSEYATISADGSIVVFLSSATNLLAAIDPHAAALDGSLQIYAYALRDNPATGQQAGTMMLVSGNPDGTISDGTDYNPVVTRDGRFVLYQSVDGNSQVHLVDLLTGEKRIVSTNAEGEVANAGVSGATISADGNTLVFQTTATNLLEPGTAAPDLSHSQQIFAKNLATGQVTLLSEAGYVPADAVSQDPAVSADGTVAAFASTADNLAPGVLGSANRAPTSRGYVTSIASTPVLTIATPAGPAQTTTVVLTGTIDHDHAATPITIIDAADPGFLPATATVAAGSDPYHDIWTTTVIFTRAGMQTITATAGSVSAQATVTLLTAPPLTIDPVDDGAIIATGAPGHTTTVTGSNPAASGDTVSLFLRTEDGKLLPLGAAVTAADGTWSVSVPDAALGSQTAESDVLLAETVNASGTTLRASESVALSVPLTVTLYGLRFTFADGSFYTGTVADDGSFGYAPGRTISTSGGSYLIAAAAGPTDQAPGTVTVISYFDVSTATAYTPASGVDGSSGLGSEADSITGPAGTQRFGGGVTEARQATATAYSFAFVYNDGSAYTGTVIGGAASAYQTGQVVSNGHGFYRITGSLGASTAAIGTVSTSVYYDAASAASYIPVLAGQGQAAGTQGLGSESDTLPVVAGSSTSPSLRFGLAGVDKAAYRLTLAYTVHFYYADGSAYYGTVVDDGTYGYAVNQTIKVTGGTYVVTAASATTVSVGGSTLTPGEVSIHTYYDASTQHYYEPGHYAAGTVAGSHGLGSEIDYTTGISGNQYFGSNGTLEAKQAPNQLVGFTFTYKDGSHYSGSVIDDGSYGYYVGDTITTPYGHYFIHNSSPLSVGEGGLVAGQVYTDDYFDITSGGHYRTLYGLANQPSGMAGLGSESDGVLDPNNVYQTFGDGGRYEAKLTPYTLLDFTFTYKDGSQYKGQLSSDGVNGPAVGQTITGAYGYYYIYAYGGATALAPETVTISTYYDVTNGKTYTPHPFSGASNYGASGLPLAVGYVDGPLTFGYSGEYEAKHAPNTSWQFQFIYNDGAYYIGDVVDNGQAGFRPGFIESTPYGYYNITGATTATALPVGTVTIDYYYDVTTGQVYMPTGEGPQGIDGTAGLGSEYADTTDHGNDEEFGFGGQYEARQSQVTTYGFTFRYTDGSFYSGQVATLNLYAPGTLISVAGGYYGISEVVETQSSLTPGIVKVSSYFSIGSGQFYTPVRYADGKPSGIGDLGSELDYVVAGGGLRSFGGSTHGEANTGFALAVLVSPVRFAFDGPIQGATVGYLDPASLPGAPGIDPAQPTTTTNADGSYQLDGGTGQLVLTGGTDTATGLAFRGMLESAGTGAVLSPVTTLLQAVAVARGDTSLPGITIAEALLSTALGLPAGLDLTSYLPGEILRDPTASPNDVPAAAAVYRAGARLLDAETLIDAAGGSSQAAIAALAAALADGSLTDLGDLAALIEDGGLAPPAETAIKTIVTATDAALNQQLAGVTAPLAIQGLISGASMALQGDAAAALATQGADDAAVAARYVQTLAATLQQADRQALNPNIACYCHGTLIRTATGDVPVEALRIGDAVVTASGPVRSIRWIGRRSYDGRFVAGNPDILPVRFRRGAIADGVPLRDLLVSPRHAMFLDGVLIPAGLLVNGASVVQVADMQVVDYFHVELDSHDVLVADGAPSESFVDCDSRLMFQNAHEFAALYPDGIGTPWRFCAERVESGATLEAVRRRIAARAGLAGCHVGDAAEAGAPEGCIDVANHARVSGWAFDPARPHTRLDVEILVDGVAVAVVPANAFRNDLAQAGKGAGRCAFAHAFVSPLAAEAGHRLAVRIASAVLLEATLPPARPPGHHGVGSLEGRIDQSGADAIAGWAYDATWPDIPVELDIMCDDVMIGRVLADRFRSDLAAAGKGSGRCAFRFELPPVESDESMVAVRRTADGTLVGIAPLSTPDCSALSSLTTRARRSLPRGRAVGDHAAHG